MIFYTSKNIEKYPPDGKMDICKKCLTMHVDNWDPETYKWILQEIDVPYIKEEWDVLLEKYGKDPKKVTGLTIMYIRQHRTIYRTCLKNIRIKLKNMSSSFGLLFLYAYKYLLTNTNKLI